ncbi:MAG: PadR family transcriptional regulator [Clostridia bacterium]|nr:PadR family transcriptional regulator [Clostridia bacterium]
MVIQFKKGVLELCILCMLEKGDCYGYDIANRLSENIEVADGSVYPVLRRLKNEGNVTSYLTEASGGPPRKYYSITEKGKKLALQLRNEWCKVSKSVDNLIAKGDVL